MRRRLKPKGHASDVPNEQLVVHDHVSYFRVIVCGSRTFSDVDLMETVLSRFPKYVYDRFNGSKELMIKQGGANGADKMARAWCNSVGVQCFTYNADWDQHGKAAGPIRNKIMLESGADMTLAFFAGERTKGTAHMVTISRLANLEVHEYGLSNVAPGRFG